MKTTPDNNEVWLSHKLADSVSCRSTRDGFDLLVCQGTDGLMTATRLLAEEIIAGQTIEIQSMQRRLISLRQPDPVVAENEFPVLGGTRGP